MASSRTWRRAACSPVIPAGGGRTRDAIVDGSGQQDVDGAGLVGQDDGPVAAEDDAAVLGGLEHVPVVLLHQLVVGCGEQRLTAAVFEDAGAAAEGAEDPAQQAVVGLLDAGSLGLLDRGRRERLRLPLHAERVGHPRPDVLRT